MCVWFGFVSLVDPCALGFYAYAYTCVLAGACLIDGAVDPRTFVLALVDAISKCLELLPAWYVLLPKQSEHTLSVRLEPCGAAGGSWRFELAQ